MAYARTFTSSTHGLRWLVLLIVAAALAFFVMLSAAGAQDVDPPTPTTPANLAALRAVITAHTLRDSEAALTGWDSVVLPTRTAEWEAIGRTAAHLDDEDFDLALDEANTAVQLNPQNAVAHYYLGVVYLNILADRGVNVPLPGDVNPPTGGRPNATPYFTDPSYSATPYFVDKTNSATPYFTDSSYSATPYFVNRPTTPAPTTLSAINTPVGSTIQNDSAVAPPSTSGATNIGGTSTNLAATEANGSSLDGLDADAPFAVSALDAGDPTTTAVDLEDDDALLQAAVAELQLSVTLEPQLDRAEPLLDVDPGTINEVGGSPTVADLMQALGVTNFRSTALKLIAAIDLDPTAAIDESDVTAAALSTTPETTASDSEIGGVILGDASRAVMDQPLAAPVAYAVAFRRSLRADAEAFRDAARSLWNRF